MLVRNRRERDAAMFDSCFVIKQGEKVVACVKKVGQLVSVLVSPKASRSGIVQQDDGSLKVFVSSPAVDGKANKEAIKLVAKWFGVPKSNVSIRSGRRSRRKVFVIER